MVRITFAQSLASSRVVNVVGKRPFAEDCLPGGDARTDSLIVSIDLVLQNNQVDSSIRRQIFRASPSLVSQPEA